MGAPVALRLPLTILAVQSPCLDGQAQNARGPREWREREDQSGASVSRCPSSF
jgi:hypothetical protein